MPRLGPIDRYRAVKLRIGRSRVFDDFTCMMRRHEMDKIPCMD